MARKTWLDQTPYYLEITARAKNALKRNGLETIADTERLSDKEMLALPSLGRVTLKEIRRLSSEQRQRYHTHGTVAQ